MAAAMAALTLLSHGFAQEEFGGLKKFLENYPDTFLISNDHPFNPHVYLRTYVSLAAVQLLPHLHE